MSCTDLKVHEGFKLIVMEQFLFHRLVNLETQFLPIAVVCKRVVAGESQEHPKPRSQREKYLSSGIHPHLEKICKVNLDCSLNIFILVYKFRRSESFSIICRADWCWSVNENLVAATQLYTRRSEEVCTFGVKKKKEH